MNIHLNSNLALETTASIVRAQDAATDARAELAAQFIPAGSRVLDLSASLSLEQALPNGCSYQGRDRIRCDAGAVCDLAGGDFPTQAAAQSDIIVMLGALEQVADVENFFTHLRFCKQDVVLSYCATDLTGTVDRAALGFANHLSFYDLALLFDRYGFRIECTAPVDGMQSLMRLTPTDRLKPVTACSVAVVSGDGSFGDRLGCHMINALLPGEAEVHHLTFGTLHEAREKYDLVVLGLGDSMFQPLLGDDVLGIVGRAKASIGIFGTQYRELIPRPAIDRLIERLDTWYARTEEDVLIYGRGAKNVVHLGDWTIDQFPMSRPSEDEPLEVSDDIKTDNALDRAIQIIQRHRQVYSTRLHPLLCALTSAELVAYADEPAAQMPDMASGKFRSTLIDIFGRSFPEKKFFMVDRDAVTRYKARVHRNVGKLGERIDTILRNVAVAN
ncbi:MAG TPA: hypothetical protein VGC38_01245 [Pseudolabrys sp.]